MNQKLSVLIVMLLVVTMITAGCLGGDDNVRNNNDKKDEDREILRGEIAPATGWATAGTGNAHSFMCEGPVVYLKLTISLMDYDAEHAEFDQGSPPDNVEVTLTNGNDSITLHMLTGISQDITFPTQAMIITEGFFMPQTWTLIVEPESGQPGASTGRFGRRAYFDQGSEWSITGIYDYFLPLEDEF